MAKVVTFNWANWRTRSVWYKGKKIKLRHYITINALLMRQHNKPGWHKVDHILNYKIALSRYGLAGLKHYENKYYHDIPMPYQRNLWQKITLKIIFAYYKCKDYLSRRATEFFLAKKQLFKKLYNK